MILSTKVGAKKIPLKNRRILLFFLILISFLFIGLAFSDQITKATEKNIILRTHIKSLGISGVDRDINPYFILKNFSVNLINIFKKYDKYESLIIDMDFENFSQLREDRSLALEDGIINKTSLNNVKGRLRIGEKKIKADLRLKGWFLDHIATDRWSLRVKVKNDNIDGIRDFSINGPFTRDFQSSPLIKKAMRFKGILTPRDGYYDVTLNGNNIGVMYFEERYSEQFTDASARPFGPIIYYDEKSKMYTFHDDKKFWANDQNLRFIYSNIINIQKNPKMYLDYLDQNLWAEYLAVSFLFKCFHGNLKENLSFYFHPIEKSIQPISSDNSCGQKELSRKLGFLPKKNEFVYNLLRIKSFKDLVKNKITWWLESEEGKSIINDLNEDEKLLRIGLSKEAPFLGPFVISNYHLEEVIDWIDTIEEHDMNIDQDFQNNSFFQIPKIDVVPVIQIQRNKSEYLVKINDYSSQRYILKELLIRDSEKKRTINLEGISDFSEISKIFNELLFDLNSNDVLKVEFSFIDLKKNKQKRKLNANLTYAHNNVKYFENSHLDELKKYFSFDKKNKLFFLEPGKSTVLETTLIFPENYDLLLNHGSTIEFRDGVGIVLKGGFRVTGKENARVNLLGYQNEDWSGILVLAKGKEVFIDNLTVNGGNGIIHGKQHRGAFTVNKANLTIKNSLFHNNLSEDALNLVQVRGNLENTTIKNTLSDGLDIDFGEVDISHSAFINIGTKTGADAIDLSKSQVEISNVLISNVTDKAISVGEGSIAKISNLEVSSAFVGIVAKDSSDVEAKDIILDKIIYADTMSYRKKPQFNGANLKIYNLDTTLGNHIAQNMSTTSINGIKIKSEDLNIDNLYNNLMKSNK